MQAKVCRKNKKINKAYVNTFLQKQNKNGNLKILLKN